MFMCTCRAPYFQLYLHLYLLMHIKSKVKHVPVPIKGQELMISVDFVLKLKKN